MTRRRQAVVTKSVADSGVGTQLLPEMTERIVRAFRPLRIVLFGSRARGDARPTSDVDLLVVLPRIDDKSRARRDILAALSEFPVANDVVVTTPDEISRRGNLVGTILRPALRDGRVLYDAGDVESGGGLTPTDGRKWTWEAGPVGDDDRRDETRRWLDLAREDLAAAELLAARGDMAPRQACFFAQQAAEKALKAVLVFLQIDFAKTHSLDGLRDLVPPGWRLKQEHPSLVDLTDWVIKGRYLGDWPDPTDIDARDATRQARAVWESILRDLADHGFDVAAYR
jgi:uncharacterized protein